MSVHAAMRTMLVVTILGPMTLRTQGHHIREVYCFSVRQMQTGIAIGRVMASHTCQPAVVQSEALVELVEVHRRATLAIGRARRMAMLAGYGDGFARLVAQAGIDRGRTLGCADMHRMVRGCDLYWLGFGRRRRLIIRGDSRATTRCSRE